MLSHSVSSHAVLLFRVSMSVYVLGIFWTNRPRSHVVAPAAHAFARFETCRWRLRLAGYVTRAKNTQNQPALPARVLGGPASQTARACGAMLPMRFAQWVTPGRKQGNKHRKMLYIPPRISKVGYQSWTSMNYQCMGEVFSLRHLSG